MKNYPETDEQPAARQRAAIKKAAKEREVGTGKWSVEAVDLMQVFDGKLLSSTTVEPRDARGNILLEKSCKTGGKNDLH